jgi:hypothetical protein
MTIRLRFADFDTDGERFDLGGRIVHSRDLLSVALQKRVSAAFLGFAFVSGVLILWSVNAPSMVATITCLGVAAFLVAGAVHERRHPYVLVIKVLQLGTFEVVGIPAAALPELEDFLESL